MDGSNLAKGVAFELFDDLSPNMRQCRRRYEIALAEWKHGQAELDAQMKQGRKSRRLEKAVDRLNDKMTAAEDSIRDCAPRTLSDIAFKLRLIFDCEENMIEHASTEGERHERLAAIALRDLEHLVVSGMAVEGSVTIRQSS